MMRFGFLASLCQVSIQPRQDLANGPSTLKVSDIGVAGQYNLDKTSLMAFQQGYIEKVARTFGLDENAEKGPAKKLHELVKFGRPILCDNAVVDVHSDDDDALRFLGVPLSGINTTSTRPR